MKIVLMGKNLPDILPLLQEHNFTLSGEDETPELVIAHGGDGTLLQAVRMFPAVPVWPLRDAATAPQCAEHSYSNQLQKFLSGELSLQHMPLIEGKSSTGNTVTALNDIFIHNQERVSALRYQVRINGELYANEIVGDGVGLATVHGSTAYYRSITHSIFRVGLGLAFSNSTEEISHLVLPEEVQISIKIIRGPGCMVADNSPQEIVIPEGDEVLLTKSKLTAPIYGLTHFMCPQCRLLRHPNKYPAGFFAMYAQAHPSTNLLPEQQEKR